MPLRIVQSPGCVDVLEEDELGLEIGEILIDTGKIAESIGFLPTAAPEAAQAAAAAPEANRKLLRVADRMQKLAIVAATEEGVNGIIRTSNRRAGTGRTVAPARGRGCRAGGANHAGGSVPTYQALGAGR